MRGVAKFFSASALAPKSRPTRRGPRTFLIVVANTKVSPLLSVSLPPPANITTTTNHAVIFFSPKLITFTSLPSTMPTSYFTSERWASPPQQSNNQFRRPWDFSVVALQCIVIFMAMYLGWRLKLAWLVAIAVAYGVWIVQGSIRRALAGSSVCLPKFALFSNILTGPKEGTDPHLPCPSSPHIAFWQSFANPVRRRI